MFKKLNVPNYMFLVFENHVIQTLITFAMSILFIIFLINSCFPSTVIEWNNLDLNIKNYTAFLKNIARFIRLSVKTIFNCNNPNGI